MYFCRRGQENLHTLKVSDFEIKIGADRYKYVQKITSELDKNHQGNSVISDIEGTGGKMYETPGNAMCPVASFEKYLSKRHSGTDRLFLHPKDSFVESESVWYRKEPIGANTMAGFMKRLSRTAELSTEYTNHFIPATTITLLNDSGFESRHIVTVSGHKNQASPTSYCYDTSGILFNKARFVLFLVF